MNLDTFSWKVKFYEYFERNGQPMGDPIHEYVIMAKFMDKTYNELTNETKKMYLKQMLDRFYYDLCRELGLEDERN